ncbi:L-aspartate oxidase [Citrobacter sp. JGM124]|uniref:L-aspartate oxidase n=1 Tax=Citrobacter sp. JGM124 TaxID=2799789 RepID=UPI001BA7A72E|nr:L-aspartate oxidase [Citrobacter sp. JGM124]MBS0849076.1 L-aspartate oxidase [Citrobacter sp. JGM124]
MNVNNNLICDVLIIGSGAAGLTAALHLAPHCRVLVLSKGQIKEAATFYAQGGIAAVFDETDTIESHIQDTLVAGAGLCDPHAVSFVATHARMCVEWLIAQGVKFDTHPEDEAKKSYHLTREGGHSHRRILHVADATGKTVQTTLTDQALAHPNITILEYHQATDLILSPPLPGATQGQLQGAQALNHKTGHIENYYAKSVILATGGASRIYQYTTTPDIAAGEGIALAWRAGCRMANLEFNQFHPTALYHPLARNFLLTEALRGEGALLKRPDGSRFMPEIDERAELAPRDIVARAIDNEMKRLNAECMYLDISHKPPAFVLEHFPNIYQRLLELGIDLTKEAVPIVPAAHYTCGGVVVDDHGRTDIERLYAIGEVSYTGLHGANRLASNSLLECLVYGWSAATDILKHLPIISPVNVPACLPAQQAGTDDNQVLLQHSIDELRTLMWNYVGIIRSDLGLESALRRIQLLQQEIALHCQTFPPTAQLFGLRDQTQVAELIVRCAILRKESRGLHYSLDYPPLLTNGASHHGSPSILTPITSINKNPLSAGKMPLNSACQAHG